ncbi:MAG: nuclear transport factor 2 family protein [Paenibacillaceae bacterium]|nr:MAG: nuclear transport factor 2 family protein [Paenibacillaceae bacterium]
MSTNLISIFEQYVSGWKRAEIETVLETLDEDCIITECYGPVYRGRDNVRLWMEKWLGEGNRVLEWDVRTCVIGQDAAAFEWRFKCLWHGEESGFEGSSIVQYRNGKILTMREYATTADLYEWTGTWRAH